MSARYAIYFSPEDNSTLARYGECVLGRTAEAKGNVVSQNDFPRPAVATTLSATPAHYGFHATLKAPFQLVADTTESQLLEAVESMAARYKPMVMHCLSPRLLSGFMALCFDRQPTDIVQLAEECVKHFEPFRADLTPEQIAKRKPDLLSDTQRGYLNEYGYPYVLSEFRFHMTLSGSLNATDHADYIDWLVKLYESLVPDTPLLDRLAVYWQPDKTTAFTRLAQFPFA